MTLRKTLCVEQVNTGIVELVIDRPPVNALDSRLQSDLAAVLTELHGQAGLRAVLLRGAGQVFSVGADIKELAGVSDADPWRGAELETHWTTLLESLPCLTISCIQGHCLGGGLEAALCTDIRLASPDARFGLPEVRLGVVPGMGGTSRLPQVVGASWAKRLIMTGEIVSAEDACRIGLVQEVVAEPRAAAIELVTSMLVGAPLAQRIAKKLVSNHAGQAELFAERDACRRLTNTRDYAEGVSAFIAHRTPHFAGE